jgi:hypothetical protein
VDVRGMDFYEINALFDRLPPPFLIALDPRVDAAR